MIFMAGGNAYSLVHEHKNGWNPEAFRERYSEVLERFDYVVGDWGYNQLRLRGFYRDGHPRATKEFAISSFIDYINEYCNFGCAHFVLAKLDPNALPPDAVISREETPEAKVALDETTGQAAETAAALSGGMIMRWPLKERAGGPVRVPNVTVSAVARAAADAERRHAKENQHGDYYGKGSSSSGRGNASRNGQESSSSGRQGRHSSGGERRPFSQGQGGGQAPGKPHSRGPRPQQGDGSGRPDERRHSEGGSPHPRNEGTRGNESPRGESPRNANEGQRGDGSRNDSRWHGRNRRRKSFGGKPGGSRPEGAPRPEGGQSRSQE